jgi:hypothetical protein
LVTRRSTTPIWASIELDSPFSINARSPALELSSLVVMLITDRWFPLKALFWSIGSAEANIENEAVMHNSSSRAFGIPHTTELIFQVEWSIWSDGPVFGAVRRIFTDVEGNISIERKRSRYPTFTRKKKKQKCKQNSLDVTIFLVVPVVMSATELFDVGEAHDVAGAVVQTPGFPVAADGCKAGTNARSPIALLRLGSWKNQIFRLLTAARV